MARRKQGGPGQGGQRARVARAVTHLQRQILRFYSLQSLLPPHKLHLMGGIWLTHCCNFSSPLKARSAVRCAPRGESVTLASPAVFIKMLSLHPAPICPLPSARPLLLDSGALDGCDHRCRTTFLLLRKQRWSLNRMVKTSHFAEKHIGRYSKKSKPTAKEL